MNDTFEIMFGGEELTFHIVGVRGVFLIGELRGDIRKTRMMIGEQHVKREQRKRYRECLSRMGCPIDRGVAKPDAGDRIEAGRIGQQADDHNQ